MYKNKIDGLSGNDDCGQMSAWYVFSSLGFYPICPGTDEYVIGSPICKNATINLENGKTFKITAENYSPKNKYVQSILLNGKTYSKHFLTHSDIMNGGTLVFKMSSKPNKNSKNYEHPYSLSK